jgi:hypothetical protein
VITPVQGSSTIMITATTSIRGRLTVNITMAAASSARTIASGDIGTILPVMLDGVSREAQL